MLKCIVGILGDVVLSSSRGGKSQLVSFSSLTGQMDKLNVETGQMGWEFI